MATDRGALSPAARRLKVAVVAYGSRGDVEPCVAVARELQRRGHEVRIALPPNMIELATATDLTAVDYGPDSRAHLDSAAELVRDCGLSNPVAALPRIIERINAVTAAKTATLKSVAQGADLIVAGFNEQGLAGIVAEYYGVPLAAVHYFPTKVFSSWGLVATMSKQAEATQRQALGLSADSGAAREILEIQAYDELCLPGPAAEWVAPGRRPFVGALTLALPTDTDDEVMSWIDAGPAPIYFGFGSTSVEPDTLTWITAAAGRLGGRALVCSGPNDLNPTPDSERVRMVRTVNHAAVLPLCRAAVHHGGAGTTAACLRAGIPMLILWSWLDQPLWAAGIQSLKVGTAQPYSASALDSIVANLSEILSPQYSATARAVAGQMTDAAQSIAAAADLLETEAEL